MRRLGLIFLLLCPVGAVSMADGTVLRVYQTTDEQLWLHAVTAEAQKSVAWLAGDMAWAAYYAGRESVYREQLAELERTPGAPFILRRNQ